ncbi:MAG: CBS domain-containing protein [Euryarchaeota archaeon]|nr:CBS domain-containing protein [Euryarchaeota archaeon]
MTEKSAGTKMKAFYNLKVQDIMDKQIGDLPVVEKTANLDQVFFVLSEKNHVWVVETKETMKVVGVITEHDALSLLSPADVSSQTFSRPNLRSLQYGIESTAEEIMSKKPITVSYDDGIVDVLAKMKQYRVRRLPVVDEKHTLLGELTLHHLIYQYHKEHGMISKKDNTQ